MLFRIEPTMRVTACTFLGKKDLAKFGSHPNFPNVFEPTTVGSPDRVLAIALRHGVAITDGLAVDAYPVFALGRPTELRKLRDDMMRNREQLRPEHEMVDRWLGVPGETQRLDAEMDEVIDRQIDEADTEADGYLAGAVKPELVEHWRSLGGPVLP
ncbi:hypothetical protein [Micropruina sp.]|uniref:hypothetical protein n=1 Tax=Micropruina sp. TaxID=2737536 RepID=UPI0039E6956E